MVKISKYDYLYLNRGLVDSQSRFVLAQNDCLQVCEMDVQLTMLIC